MTTTETSTREITYGQAFTEGIRQVMAEDPDVFVAGEDVGAQGGVFGSFAGLQKEFGEMRSVDTPISEQAIIGLGIGAAVTGLRPVTTIGLTVIPRPPGSPSARRRSRPARPRSTAA